MATFYPTPDPASVEKGQLYFLELLEFRDGPRVAVRVERVLSSLRVEIEFIGGDHTLTIVPIGRLLVEHRDR